MASCVNNYRLSTQAENEILDIFLYGIEQFGLNQARLYKDGMDKSMEATSFFMKLTVPACSFSPLFMVGASAA